MLQRLNKSNLRVATAFFTECCNVSSLIRIGNRQGMVLRFDLSIIRTYIIDLYNPSVRGIDLVSHTTYVFMWLILYKVAESTV